MVYGLCLLASVLFAVYLPTVDRTLHHNIPTEITCADIPSSDVIIPPSELILFDGTNSFRCVYILPTTFVMGKGAAGEAKGMAGNIYNAMRAGSHSQHYEGPKPSVTLTRGYYVYETKISNKLYLEFLRETKATPENRWWFQDTFLSIQFDQDSGLYTCVKPEHIDAAVEGATYQGAVQFCAWLGKRSGRSVRLPTEAEWELAARGTEGRRYPWGNAENPGGPVNDYDELPKVHLRRATVKKHPLNATPENIFDMCCGVEWCADYYAELYPDGTLTDPLGPATGESRVLRGGRKNVLHRVSGNISSPIVQSVCNSFRFVVDTGPVGDLPRSIEK